MTPSAISSAWMSVPRPMHEFQYWLTLGMTYLPGMCTRSSELKLMKSTFNAENFICRLSWSNSSNFVAIQYWNVHSIQILPKNSLKTPFGKVQGHSRSSMLINLKSLSPVLVIISSMSVPICNHFYGRRANSDKITSFYSGCPFFASLFVGTP